MDAVAREQRLVFGEVAELYHRHRPGYPAQVLDEVAVFGRLQPGSQVLEVGAGTGKATTALVDRGLRVTALEPSSEMAAVARRQLEGARGWEVVEQSFEAWDPAGRTFDALVAAQSWHWVAPEVGYLKAARVLSPSGALALIWNRPRLDPDPVASGISEVYRRLVPGMVTGPPGERQIDRTPELDMSGQFASIRVCRFSWEAEYTAADYRSLLLTQSDHRMLPPDLRQSLLDAVAGVISGAGRPYRVGYQTILYLARPSAQTSPV